MIITVWILTVYCSTLPTASSLDINFIRFPDILNAYNLCFTGPEINTFHNVRLLKTHHIPSLFQPYSISVSSSLFTSYYWTYIDFHPATGSTFTSLSQFIPLWRRTYKIFPYTILYLQTDFYSSLLDLYNLGLSVDRNKIFSHQRFTRYLQPVSEFHMILIVN